jgi:hypothetical protein
MNRIQVPKTFCEFIICNMVYTRTYVVITRLLV